MKNKKILLMYIIVVGLIITGSYGFTRYQQHCSVDDSPSITNGMRFSNMQICHGEYYIKIEDVEPNNDLEMTTMLSNSPGSWVEKHVKTIKKGDEIIVDKSQPIWYMITDPTNEDVRITTRLYKR